MSAELMRAARLYGKEDLRVEDVPVPEVSAGEVLLRVRAAAVCGTDIRMLRNGSRGVTALNPLIPGHEIAGVIERVGPGVAGYGEGMRVAVAPNMGCGVCDRCVGGNTQLCAGYRALGISLDGGFAEYVKGPRAAVQQGNLIQVPAGVDFAEAALVEPLSCVYNAFLRCAISPGDTVLVIGAGPIGLMHAKLARMAGAASVFMNDTRAERLALCREVEPSIVAIASAGLAEEIGDRTQGRGVDVCITACAAPEAQAAALELVALNGRVMLFGGLPEGKSGVTLDTNIVHYRQISITATTRSNLAQFRKALALVASGLVRVRDLITGSSTIDGIHSSFEQAMQGRGLKNVILFPGP